MSMHYKMSMHYMGRREAERLRREHEVAKQVAAAKLAFIQSMLLRGKPASTAQESGE